MRFDDVIREIESAARAWPPDGNGVNGPRAFERGREAIALLSRDEPNVEAALVALEEAAIAEGGFGSRPSYDAALQALGASVGLPPSEWSDA